MVTNMNTRLKQFLSAENISQAQFADSINVVRASVSHVLSGRNNPSYEFIKAIMSKYPLLNIEWLMLGKGKMYRESAKEAPVEQSEEIMQDSDLLFSDADYENKPEEVITPPVHQSNINIASTTNINRLNNAAYSSNNQRNISKIIVLFDDGTYQEM